MKEYPARWYGGAKASVRALDQATLRIPGGVRIALIGGSGSGKSTLAACLACLAKLDSGKIRFEGQDVTGFSERKLRNIRRQVQLVVQDPASAFNPAFTVLEVLEEPWIAQRKIKFDRRGRAAELLSRVGLPRNILGRKPVDLSGGQRQRLAIARALALDPKVLILDEALSALDYSVQAQIVNLLLDLTDQSIPFAARPAILLVTHDLVMAGRFADEVAVMQNGRIVETGSAQRVLGNPEHSATRALVASMSGHALTDERPTV